MQEDHPMLENAEVAFAIAREGHTRLCSTLGVSNQAAIDLMTAAVHYLPTEQATHSKIVARIKSYNDVRASRLAKREEKVASEIKAVADLPVAAKRPKRLSKPKSTSTKVVRATTEVEMSPTQLLNLAAS